MVEHDVRPHGVHKMVESLGGKTLKKGVGVSAAADAVHHLGTIQILFDHLVHGVDVVLPIAVDGDGNIAAAAVQRLHKTCQHSVLVSPVAALGNTDKVLILCGKAPDQLPRFILGAVVDKEHTALVADKPGGSKIPDLLQKHGGGDRQHLLFVVAGDHDP